MKVLICLFAVLAAANAGYLRSNGLYGNGIYGAGGYISAPVASYAAPAIQPVYHSGAPSVYAAPASIYNNPAIYQHSVPLIAAGPASIYHSSPFVGAAGAPALSYGFNSGFRYGNTYPGFLKHK